MTDQGRLADLVKFCPNTEVSSIAAARLTGQKVIADLLKSGRCSGSSSMSLVERLTIPLYLVDVAKSSEDHSVCLRIIDKLTDPNDLADIIKNARNTTYSRIHVTAAEKKLAEMSTSITG